MFDTRNVAIIDLCQTYHLVEDSILLNLRRSSEELSRSVASLLVDQGHVSREVLLDRVANYLSLERRSNVPPDIPSQVIGEIDVKLARMYGVVPIESLDTGILFIAIDPFDSQVVDDLSFAVGKEARIEVADPQTVQELLDVYYRFGDADYLGILEEVDYAGGEADDMSVEDLLNMAGETPIIRFVNLVLSQAIKDKASDVHFEPFDTEFKIR
ncbi:MAG: GspE/PulE/PilB domain-containing protein, partial [Verrucomicrobiia bacterium]